MVEPWRERFASSDAIHEKMSRQRRRDTAPEMLLRRELHRRGLRYFVHRRPVADLRREADIIFPRTRVAVFVDGCFWHGCPDHGSQPAANGWYWQTKIERNRKRDIDTNQQLERAGWSVVRLWEHQSPTTAADIVIDALMARVESDAGVLSSTA